MYGLKDTSHFGITSKIINIIQFSILHFNNKIICITNEHKFYFLDKLLTNSTILNFVNSNTQDKKYGGIWVYDAKIFISYENSVKECQIKYNIAI